MNNNNITWRDKDQCHLSGLLLVIYVRINLANVKEEAEEAEEEDMKSKCFECSSLIYYQ